jgi:glyoxylase-like metal-dependent hydrolase (beta-lactamase superfamily II)
MAEAAVRLADTVWRIPTAPRDLINSFALTDADGSVTLIDCGLARATPRLVAGLAAMGKAPQDVTRIVLTHAHDDHAGAAAATAALTGTGVTVHEDDAVHLREGTTPALDQSLWLGRLASRRPKRITPVEVTEVLTDGQVLPVAGGLRVVHTPGHTPGHMSLLHEPTGVLITGDSIFNVFGLRWPPKAFCTDFRMNARTAHVLGELDYRLAAFTHGTEIRDHARERVRAFVRAAQNAA